MNSPTHLPFDAGARRAFVWIRRAQLFVGLVSAMTFSAPTRAQSSATGTVTGSVIDATTGKFLEGAEVAVEGTAVRTATEREGRFSLRDVPTGTRTIVVSYPG